MTVLSSILVVFLELLVYSIPVIIFLLIAFTIFVLVKFVIIPGFKKLIKFKYMDAASKAFTVFLMLFIIDIPLSFVIPYLFLYLGALVDGAMYNPSPNMPGHAVPIFTGFGFVIGIYVALILAVALLVGLIISFSFFLASKINKKNKNKS